MASPGYIAGPLIIPLTFQMRLLWTLPNSKTATNVLHLIVPDGTVNSQALADALYDGIVGFGDTAPYLAYLSSETSLVGVDVRDIRTASQALFQSTGLATAGTGGGNALPEEVSLVVTLRTALAGRAHRGRIFLTGFDDSTLDVNGHADATFVLTTLAFVAGIVAIIGENGMDLGVGHRGHAEYINAKGATVAAEAAGTDRVTNVIVRDNVFDSQRRRK